MRVYEVVDQWVRVSGLPPMVQRQAVQKWGAFRVQSHKAWSRLPVRDERFTTQRGKAAGKGRRS